MIVVGLGDSNTWGYPEGPNYSWLHDLGQKLSCQVINHGINGECFADMRVRVPQVVAEHPDIVIITGGTNDAFEGISVAQAGAELTTIVDELKAKTSAYLMIGLPIPLDYMTEELLLRRYREWMKNFSAQRNIVIVDFYSALLDPYSGGIMGKYNADGVHPNREGFKRMAEEAYSRVKEWDKGKR